MLREIAVCFILYTHLSGLVAVDSDSSNYGNHASANWLVNVPQIFSQSIKFRRHHA